MNDARSNPEPQLSQEELRYLLREGDPPFTRRELRMRERAEEAGLLIRVDGVLQLSTRQAPSTGSATPAVPRAPIRKTVPASTGMTRRQLRELEARRAAEQEASVNTGDLEKTAETVRTPPKRISTRRVADDLQTGDQRAPERPVEQTARRPVVRPEGAATGEYTGEFDQIRRAMADINSAPDAAPVTPPERRSIFDVSVPEALSQENTTSEPATQPADAADVSTLMDLPIVTDDVFTDDLVTESAVERDPTPTTPDGPRSAAPATAPTFPDWHAISGIQQPAAPARYPEGAAPEEDPERTTGRGSLLLTVLQWIVIVAVAVVLGLLVWYAINRGFGEEGPEAAGIFPALHYLRT